MIETSATSKEEKNIEENAVINKKLETYIGRAKINDIFWQNLLNQKSPDWWKKDFDYQEEVFFII